jgi:hypothetical protein
MTGRQWLLALVVLAGGCATPPAPGALPAASAAALVAPESSSPESSFVSAKYDYEWRLPGSWELVPPESVDLHDAPPWYEVAAARPRGGASRDSLLLLVTDLPPDKRLVASFEAYGTKWLLYHGVSRSAISRTTFLGNDAVRLDGEYALPSPRYFTMTLFQRDRRRFELRCLTAEPQSGMPCQTAIAALTIHEPKPEPPGPGSILHVREPRFSLSYDAPNDDWLAQRPESMLAGRNIHWTWNNGTGKIELGVSKVGPAGERVFLEHVSRAREAATKAGATVATEDAILGGQPCVHVRIDKANEPAQDVFYMQRGDSIYLLAVTSPKRDADLVEKVRAGLRLETPSPP